MPFVFPIDQEQVVKAITHDTKLSKSLYSKLGEDVEVLKKNIQSELSRGISQNYSYAQIARNIANQTNIGYNRASRIARTESHRISQEAAYNAQKQAQKAGADIVKQWEASLDKRTRNKHRQLDGQIRELDEPFEIDGHKAMYPGGFGVPSLDIHCRCVVLQRAKWALDEEELETLKQRAEEFGLDKSDSFEDYKKKYLKVAEDIDKLPESGKIKVEEASEIRQNLEKLNIKYLNVEPLSKILTSDEIVDRLGGGDMTRGSCSSLGFAYIGNKNGLDVLDFRDGASREFFSYNSNIEKMLNLQGIKGSVTKVEKEISETIKIISDLPYNKEYYLAVGRHAAIIKNTKNGAEYLELQSATNNGWTPFNNERYGTMANTLFKRFGCRKTIDKMKMGGRTFVFKRSVVLMDVDSFNGNDEFKNILGYLNTSSSMQKKGVSGNVK